ncbi:MAG: peroxiredoxin [Candidatus Altiarchaeota archaeon]|nr:peroxiredoxin [Candidatus Altiarchaeota archaeon]
MPSFEAETTQGTIKFPEAYRGHWTILFSHPADFTPVCTTEFHAFQTRMESFKKLNTKLIGLSMDQVFSHLEWLEWIHKNLDIKIEFPVIADHSGEIAKKLGMLHPNAGKSTVRAVFVLDPKGIIRTLLYYPGELGRNLEEIHRIVKGLQLADLKKVALPANWPKNEIIGSKVLIPPAKSKQEAEKNKEGNECKDWWFCYKSV